MHWYPRYVPVDEQRARTVSEIRSLRARGVKVQPVEIRGRTIARNFWGRRWCEHLESFSEYAARLAHGRAYVRNGSVCHLAIEPGGIDAMVVGSTVYHVSIRIRRLERSVWTDIRAACAGRIGSVPDLRQGRFPARVAEVVTHRDTGMFPQPGEIVPSCECSDRETMCKHAAAVLSGVGSRFDEAPELLFLLRGVDETELISDAPVPTRDVAAGGGALHAGNGAAPNAAERTVRNAAGPAGSNGSAPEPPGSTGPAPPRKVKKTLTWRPPQPPPALPRNRPADHLPEDAAEFQPSGELVAGLREQCGCSIAEFAELLGVTPTTVRRWEAASGPLNLHARPWEALLALRREIEKHVGA